MLRIPERIADLVVRRPGVILVVTLGLTLGLVSRVPTLVVNPSPEDLITTFGSYNEVRERFRRDFGTTDQVALLVVSAEDVSDAPVLGYVHELSRRFAAEPGVFRVESLTTTPIPKPEGGWDGAEGNDPGLTLEALEAEPEEDLPPDVLGSLLDLVEAAPGRFPLGLTSISERRAALDVRPVVEGDTPTRADVRLLRAALDDSPLIVGRLVSQDRHVTVIALSLSGDHSARRETIARIDRALDQSQAPRGVELARGGLPYVRAQLVSNMQRDNRILLPLTLLVCALLLLASFRSLAGTILPLTTVGIATGMLVGGMALFGEPMTIITNVIPPMLIIIGLEDSIHIVDRFREEMRHTHGDRTRSLHTTVRTIALACFMTSVTNAVGIAALFVAHTAELRRFALLGSIGVMLAYVVTILFLPAALMKWKGVGAAPPPREEKLETALALLTAWVVRRPWRIIIITTAVTITAMVVSRSLVVDHALMDQFDRDDPIARSTGKLEAHLEGVRPLEVSLLARDSDRLLDPAVIAKIDRIERWALADEAVLGATSYADVLHDAWAHIAGDGDARAERFRTPDQTKALVHLLERSPHDPLDRFLAAEGRHGRLRIMVGDVGAQATMRFVERLERKLAPLRADGIEVALSGEAFTGSVGTNAVIGDLFSSLGAAVAVIFAILALLFRSVRLGLLSVPSNVIPLAGTTAWMVIRGIPLNLATAIIFSISIGLAVNGTIHFLARYREEAERGIARSVSLVRSARGAGRGVVVACVGLMMGFGVLLFSSFVPVRHFGELIAVSAGLSLLSTLLVQPALLKVGGIISRPTR